MAVTYLNAITVCDNIRKLKEETIPAHKENIDRQRQILENNSRMVQNKNGGNFIVNGKLFGTEVQQSIEAQLGSNLGIAKGVTLAVAEKVIERDNAFFNADFEARKAKMSVFERQAFNRPGHPLQPELDKRKSAHSVFDEIEKRVKALPATVNPAPASIPAEEVTLDVGDDADASSAGKVSNRAQTLGSTQTSTIDEVLDVDLDEEGEGDTLFVKYELSLSDDE